MEKMAELTPAPAQDCIAIEKPLTIQLSYELDSRGLKSIRVKLRTQGPDSKARLRLPGYADNRHTFTNPSEAEPCWTSPCL